jgi:beta-xylosidase
VTFRALPGQIAGGIFGCRIIRFDRSQAGLRNPIFQGADPDLLLVDGVAWVYPTHRDGKERRFFAYSSADLIHWRMHGPILDFADIDWIPGEKQAWAPGVTQKNGNFYLYYSVGPKPSHIGVAVANSPAGLFRDSGRPLLSDEGHADFEAIDAMVFTDPQSGKSYLYAGGSAGARLRIWELNEDMVSFAREIDTETPPSFTEGPFVHYRDGVYYLSYSYGVWWDGSYTVHYATSETPYGPWLYRGPIMSSDEKHRGPGHHSILHQPDSDEWFVFYHRWNNQRERGPYNTYRQIAVDRIEYGDDGLIKPVTMTDTFSISTRTGE